MRKELCLCFIYLYIQDYQSCGDLIEFLLKSLGTDNNSEDVLLEILQVPTSTLTQSHFNPRISQIRSTTLMSWSMVRPEPSCGPTWKQVCLPRFSRCFTSWPPKISTPKIPSEFSRLSESERYSTSQTRHSSQSRTTVSSS